jgi:3-deoxy-D-manno-octulosonate 8-phosphate phosphatase (KDO 8-P phosphatase)
VTEITNEIRERIQKVKLVILDNDGVLTDGRIVLGDYGDELKFFDVQDGLGLVLLSRAGIKTVMISGKKSKINRCRAKETCLTEIYQNISDKLKVFEKVIKKFKVGAPEVCCVGDDLVDLPILLRAGFAVAVENATDEVKQVAHYVTVQKGGCGAVREVADLILKTQGKWPALVEKYYR